MTLTSSNWDLLVAEFHEAHIQHLAQWRSYSVDFCRTLVEHKLVGRLNGRIAFPIFDENNVVSGCQSRCFGEKSQVDWKVDWFTHSPEKLHPLVIRCLGNAATAYVFESQWDMFAFMDICGWHRGAFGEESIFLSTRGTPNFKWAINLSEKINSLVLFPQNDKPGLKWATDIALGAKSAIVRGIKIPSSFKDFNDWLKGGATEAAVVAALETSDNLRQPIIEAAENYPLGYGGGEGAAKLPDGRKVIGMPGDNMLVSDFAEKLGGALAGTDLFRRDGGVFEVDAQCRTLKQMQPDVFRTWLEDYVVCARIKNGAPKKLIKHTLSRGDAEVVLVAPRFTNKLKEVVAINPISLPVIRKSGALELLPIGYDSETKSFTLCPENVNIESLSLEDSKAYLDNLMSEFCFYADEGLSRAVAIAAMLTPFGRWLMSPQAIIPAFMVAANAEGAGKSLLVKLAIVPMMGACAVSPKPDSEDEIRKRLTCAVMNGEPAFLFDNVRNHISSAALEAFITADTWTDRILGASKTFTGEKRTVVFITGNGCTMSADLRRRCLVAELFLAEGHPEQRRFSRNLDTAYLLQNRGKILSALMGLIRAWDTSGRPKPSQSNASFPEWAEIVGGIVEHARYKCPVRSGGQFQVADPDLADIETLLQLLASEAGQRTCSFQDIAQIAFNSGVFDRFFDEHGEMDRRGKSTFSKILKRYSGRMIRGICLSIRQGVRNERYLISGEPRPLPHIEA